MKLAFAVVAALVLMGAWPAQFPAHAVAHGAARAQTQNRAGVVVQFSDGHVVSRCIAFGEDSISGYDLLRRTGLPLSIEVGGMGAGVCKIDNEGCAFPSETCFCKCATLGEGCNYWAYSQLKDGAWVTSGIGAGTRMVRNGDVDGWRWGVGNGDVGSVPVSVSFDSICSAAEQPTVAPSPAPTNAPTNAPSATQTTPPTVVPSPAPTTAPANAPSATQTTPPSAWPYAAFGAIVAGLLAAVALTRRNRGNR